MHTPVLLNEAIDGLGIRSGGKYIDGTYGEGGHSVEIVKRGGRVLAIDFDEENVKKQNEVGNWKLEIENSDKLKLVWGNYADIEKIAQENNFVPADGIILDLGLSMEQIGRAGRGFSYKKRSEPLDMRISSSLSETAADIVNSYSKNELYELFSKNAEELDSWALAGAVFGARNLKPFITVDDLVSVIEKESRHGDVEATLKRIFQALRISVNHEFENLRKGLDGSQKIVKPGGRIAIITFHQGEDRIVKQFISNDSLRPVNKKVITVKIPRHFEKTAKLRIFEKI